MANEDNTIHANMRIVMSHLQLNAANCPKQKPLFSHGFVHFESCLQKGYQAGRASIKIRYQKECEQSRNKSTIVPAVASHMSTL